jgi:hypothetical protein
MQKNSLVFLMVIPRMLREMNKGKAVDLPYFYDRSWSE